MDFGPLPLDRAAGAVLAHSVPLPGGGRLRKGLVLTDEVLARLAAAGVAEVIAARLAPGDVGEDAAALALAQALVPDPAGQGLSLRPVGTGRVNIHASGPGVLALDAAAIDAVNAADPMITLATLPRFQRVQAGEMVATVKIIAYAVPGTALDRACAVAGSALALRPPRLRQAVLIQTFVDPEEDGEKGQRVIGQRLRSLNVALAAKVLVPHRLDPLAEAIRAASTAELILILTASATSDPRDVAPSALRQAGGQVERFGMPVDPGNLLFFGALGGVPVIGLPGCAKSPALNGADWVMERLICGIPVAASDIAAMGVGGLLKEIASRPQPREPRP